MAEHWRGTAAPVQVWCPIFTSSLRYTCGCGVRSSTFVCVSAFVSHRQTVCCSTVGRHGRLGRSRFRSASLPPPCSRPSPPSRFEKYHSKDDYAESWISILMLPLYTKQDWILMYPGNTPCCPPLTSDATSLYQTRLDFDVPRQYSLLPSSHFRHIKRETYAGDCQFMQVEYYLIGILNENASYYNLFGGFLFCFAL